MAKVFIAGSISIKNIHEAVLKRIQNMIDGNFHIIIGDANGVDKLVQAYLYQQNYKNITVYHSGDKARHNIGHWQTKAVTTSYRKGTREFFTAKDIEMAKDAAFGLMLWDSQSTGTLKNVIELISANKKLTIFIHKEQRFQKVYTIEELESLKKLMSDHVLQEAERKINFFERIEQLKQQPLYLI